MEALISLNVIEKTGIAAKPVVGGKGQGLLEIIKNGLPCPETWVVPSALFSRFTANLPGNLADYNLEAKVQEYIARFLAEVAGRLPDGMYAVRSSALVEDSTEYSFAGMFESKLNIGNADIPQAVAQVWLSGLGKRVKEYSKSGEWPEMAVLIQPMVTARFSGVCFSQHPSPGTISQNGTFLIELVSGSGEQLVQGEVTPIRITGTYGTLVTCTDYPWVPDLLDAVSRLEVATGGPVDVEFAVDSAEKLWLLQQRPVTKISTSLTIDMRGYKKVYKRALCSLDIEFLIDGCARHLAAYLEAPVDLTGWMVMLSNQQDGQQELWINKQADGAVSRYLAGMFRSDKRYMERLKTRYDHHHRRILNCKNTAWADHNLPLETRLQDFFEFIVPINAHYYAPMFIIEALSVLLLGTMRSVDPENADDDFFTLTTSGISTLGNDFELEIAGIHELIARVMGQIPQDLNQLSQDLRAKIEELAEKYGFLNCHQPYEKPYSVEYVYNLVRTANIQTTNNENTTVETNTTGGSLKPVTTGVIEKYRTQAEWEGWYSNLIHWLNIRNKQMEYLYYAYAKADPLLTLVGEKIGISLEDVWNSQRTYLLDSLKYGLKAQSSYRRSNLTLVHNGREVVVSDQVTIIYPDTGTGAGELKGKTVFGVGELSGTVKVAFTPEELEAVNSLEGIIVVTGMTTPDFVPLLKQAAGLITDEGGILCHAAIIAREIRIPCLVGTGFATERLKNGMKIKMDLDRGEISIC